MSHSEDLNHYLKLDKISNIKILFRRLWHNLNLNLMEGDIFSYCNIYKNFVNKLNSFSYL